MPAPPPSAVPEARDAPPHDSVDALLDLAVVALGGQRRDGQHEMAIAVTASIEAGEHLLVQAGTGTGKSLGYLVPAVRHAVLASERVVVSTATLALQRQVIARDLPLVAAALAPRLPRAPVIALLKGWHNYLCLQKLAGGYPPDEPGTLFDLAAGAEHPGAAEHPALAGRPPRGAAADLGAQVVRLRGWAEETATGDRDDLVPGVSDRAWRQVSVTALECLGARCPMLDDCFPQRARTHAKEADVVVTNHAMLGIAAAGSPNVLPEHEVLIVDEAHELTDRVTAQATVELSVASLEHAGRLARRQGGLPTTDLDSAAAALGAALIGVPEGRLVGGLPDPVRGAVSAVRDAARTLVSALRPDPAQGRSGGDGADPAGGLRMAAAAMLAVFEIAERIAGAPVDGSGTDVLWCSRADESNRRDAGMPRLHAAPLNVSGLIRSQLLAGRSTVLTSATLSLGGSFDVVAGSVGLARTSGGGTSEEPPATWRGLDVGSPFDYPRQGILYIATSLPPPGREAATEAQLDEIADLVRAAGGRTLGLFSSRRAAQLVAEAMRERLDVPVLAQGDDQLPTLVRVFADDEPTCLFGTLSLWQGVDVPGATCRLVLIDRIPFPRPDDPIRSARSDAANAAGGNGFMAVSAAHAALLLAQGAGRLIRTTEDRGVVAVLDPRLATARYGEFLARSLPPFWRTTDREVALAALRRLSALS